MSHSAKFWKPAGTMAIFPAAARQKRTIRRVENHTMIDELVKIPEKLSVTDSALRGILCPPAAKAEDAVAKKTTTAAGNIRRKPCIGIRPDSGTRERSIYELDFIQVEFVKNFTKSIFARGYKDSG
jgi:hypothetical protein